MEAISTHAKEAAADKQARRHSEADLGKMAGATPGKAYLVEGDDENGDFVMVITGVSHADDCQVEDADEPEWRRKHGVPEDEFKRGIIVHAEFYRISALDPRHALYRTRDEPFRDDVSLYKEALPEFRRRRLKNTDDENAFRAPWLA